MRALRSHDREFEAPEASRTRSLVPLVAAGTLFLLGVFGIMGFVPFTGGLVSGEQPARSPGLPAPLVKSRPVEVAQPQYNLDEVTAPLFFGWELPRLVRTAVEDAEVLASTADASGVNGIEPLPPTSTPEPTATPTAEPTPTEEPTVEPTPTASPTATPEEHFVPESNTANQGGPVIGIVSSNPQPTPPGPARQDRNENEGDQ